MLVFFLLSLSDQFYLGQGKVKPAHYHLFAMMFEMRLVVTTFAQLGLNVFTLSSQNLNITFIVQFLLLF